MTYSADQLPGDLIDAASPVVASDGLVGDQGADAVRFSIHQITDAVYSAIADNDPMLATDSGDSLPTKTAVKNYIAAVVAALQGTGLDVDAPGFRGIPQNSQSGNYTALASDAGKHLYHPSGAGAGDTFTIPSNASVAFEIGTAITFVNMDSNALAIAITSDTLYLSSAGTTGSRSLAQYGIATAVKLTSTTWLISGTGLT